LETYGVLATLNTIIATLLQKWYKKWKRTCDGSPQVLVNSREIASAPRRTRTYNPLIKSQLLCQLS
jgi:hypothetical protein